jgi:hypothetical protein
VSNQGELFAPSDATLVMVDDPFVAASRNPQAFRVGLRNEHRWCHLWCVPGAEAALHSVARRIGQKRDWFQPKPGFPHYDLVAHLRERAIAAGAVPTSLRQWLLARRQASDSGAFMDEGRSNRCQTMQLARMEMASPARRSGSIAHLAG